MIGLATNPTVRQQIVAQLKELDIFLEVSGAASIVAATTFYDNLPGAYVIEIATQMGENESANGILQLGTLTYGVLISVDNVTDDFGADSSDAATKIRKQVIDKLTTFCPTLDGEVQDVPLEYMGGKMVEFAKDVLVWQDNFKLRDVTVWS